MDNIMNWLQAVVNTGDEANPTQWIWIMVIVGVLLVIMAVASVIVSKKKNAESENGTDSKKDK